MGSAYHIQTHAQYCKIGNIEMGEKNIQYAEIMKMDKDLFQGKNIYCEWNLKKYEKNNKYY